MISSGAEAADRKQRIRDRYKGVDTSELEVIPAKTVEGLGESTSIRRVAAYVRVSTDNDEQTSSYELQKNYYTDYIKAQPGWEFVGIYDDEGISGTSLEHRKGMQQLRDQVRGVGADDLPGHAVEPEQYISSGGEKRPQTATCEFRSGHSVFGGKRESSGRKSKPHKAPVWRRIVRCGKFLGLAN